MKIINSITLNPHNNKINFHIVDIAFKDFIYFLLKLAFRIATILFVLVFMVFAFSENRADTDYFYLVFVYTSFIGTLQLIKVILAGQKFLPAVKYDFVLLLFLIFLILSVIIKQYLGFINFEYLLIGEYWHISVWGFLLFSLFTYLLIINLNELTRKCYILELVLSLAILFSFLRFVFALGFTNDMLILFVLLVPIFSDKLIARYFRNLKNKRLKYVLVVSILAFIMLFAKIQLYDLSSIGLFGDLKILFAKQFLIKKVILGGNFTYKYHSFIANFLVNFGVVNFILFVLLLALIVKNIKVYLFKGNFNNSSLIVSLLLFFLMLFLLNPAVEVFIFIALSYSLLYKEIYSSKSLKWKLLMLKFFKQRVFILRLIQLLGIIIIVTLTLFVNLNIHKIFYIV